MVRRLESFSAGILVLSLVVFYCAASAFGAESPSGSQGIPSKTMQVDGVQVSGRTDAMSIMDIREAITEFRKTYSRKLGTLTVIDKDVLHGYFDNHDLGWVTVKRTIYVEPDKSRHPGWDTYGQDIGQFSGALNCIRSSQKVYAFPVTTPRDPHRDDEHERLLSAEARNKLVDLLGSPGDWFVGFNNLIYSDTKSSEVGLIFQDGKDELVLFFFHNTVRGTFNGESLNGTLGTDTSWEVHDWKQRYAQPELTTPEKAPAQPSPL